MPIRRAPAPPLPRAPRRIPFTIEAPAKDDVMAKGRAAFYAMRQAAAEAGIQDMSLDEINEEIRLDREGR